MKITFIGLSCFLVENAKGDRLLLEPYYGDSEFGLGLRFPDDIQADVFLVSHPDEDHSYLRHSMLRQRNSSNEHDDNLDFDLFPDFNLRGTFVREWNGDICIAFSFTIDGIRCMHLADNAHLLTERQLKEIGDVDIVFATMPKGDLTVAIDVIKQLNPKIAIPSHYIPVMKDVKDPSYEEILAEIKKLFHVDWMKNAHNNEFTHNVFVTVFQNALLLQKAFEGSQEINETTFEVTIETLPDKTAIRVFRNCEGMQVTTR